MAGRGQPIQLGVDWFDAVARQPAKRAAHRRRRRPDESFSFDEMALRSDRVARWLAECGVQRGDRVMLMLGNQVELWESMLAVAKPSARSSCKPPALGPRIWATGSHAAGPPVITNAEETDKFAGRSWRLRPDRGELMGCAVAPLPGL